MTGIADDSNPPRQAEAGAAREPVPWRVVGRRYGARMPLFRARYDTLLHPTSGREFERIVLETGDWVNVVALTDRRQLLLVRQYRFGSGSLTLEIPGGVIDAGEEPEAAARRELLEETGYVSDRWRLIAKVRPNPAFLSNWCYHFLAENVRAVSAPRPDAGEEISLLVVDLADAASLVHSGAIDHSLVVSALCRIVGVADMDCAGRSDP